MNEELLARLYDRLENRFYGKYRGFVVDNADPENRGRLRVSVPSVFGEQVASGWALPCAPSGGASDQGFFFVPEKEAGVWVEFEEGNIDYPVWVGTFWSKPGGEPEIPKPNNTDGTLSDAAQSPPTRKIIKTVKGHTIQLEDKDDEEMILIVEAKNKHVVCLDKLGIRITDGQHQHTVTFDENGIKTVDGVTRHEVTLDKGGIKVTDGKNKHEINLEGDGIVFTDGVNAGNKISMEGAGLTVADKNRNQLVLDSSGVLAKNAAGSRVAIEAAGITVESGAGALLVDATGVKLGGSAAQLSLVVGELLTPIITTFLTLLNTHTHIGNLGAPTSPPVAPMTLVLDPAFSKTHKIDK